MELLFRNTDGNFSQPHRNYAAKKLGRLDRYFSAAHKVELVHREERGQHRLEVTVFAEGRTFRGEQTDSSILAAIDKVADKLDVRLRRMKQKLFKAPRHRA